MIAMGTIAGKARPTVVIGREALPEDLDFDLDLSVISCLGRQTLLSLLEFVSFPPRKHFAIAKNERHRSTSASPGSLTKPARGSKPKGVSSKAGC